MKKILFVLLLMMTLTGCADKIKPLENPQPELFSVFYENEDFSILKRTIIEEKIYITIGYNLDDGYLIGASHIENYLVAYEDEYYNLQQGYQLGLFEAEDLIHIGITGISRSCSEEDTCD